MTNRNKLIDILISNLATAIVHQILEKAVFDMPEHFEKYSKEFKESWQVAKRYREKINPSDRTLPFHDISEIKLKLERKINTELNLRISKGYKNINLDLVEEYINKALKELNVV